MIAGPIVALAVCLAKDGTIDTKNLVCVEREREAYSLWKEARNPALQRRRVWAKGDAAELLVLW